MGRPPFEDNATSTTSFNPRASSLAIEHSERRSSISSRSSFVVARSERRNSSAPQNLRRGTVSGGILKRGSLKKRQNSEVQDVRELQMELQEARRATESMLHKSQVAEMKRLRVQAMVLSAQMDTKAAEELAASLEFRLADREARLEYDEKFSENALPNKIGTLESTVEVMEDHLSGIEAESCRERSTLNAVLACLGQEEEEVRNLTEQLTAVLRTRAELDAAHSGQGMPGDTTELEEIHRRLFEIEQAQSEQHLEAHARGHQLWNEHQAAESAEMFTCETALQAINGPLMGFRVSHKVCQSQVNDLELAAERSQELKSSVNRDLAQCHSQTAEEQVKYENMMIESRFRDDEMSKLITQIQDLRSSNTRQHIHEIQVEEVNVRLDNERTRQELAKYEDLLSECCDCRQSDIERHKNLLSKGEKQMQEEALACREKLTGEVSRARMESSELRCEHSWVSKSLESLRVAHSRLGKEESEQRKAIADLMHELLRTESDISLEKCKRGESAEAEHRTLRDQLLQSEREAHVLRGFVNEVQRPGASCSAESQRPFLQSTDAKAHAPLQAPKAAESGSHKLEEPRTDGDLRGITGSHRSLGGRERLVKLLQVLVDHEVKTMKSLDKEDAKGCKTAQWSMQFQ
eukprot:gnl/MRDRNA2_/MRDRNA2_103604_c0_seq1.p1 gnl/MRDRNA2_/MRDRNA2_103604_c0~~gnl/MRDRNA2_/MRDRNA2_103604_c0_seq1.p1  ORF type:complete len:636 (-),score=144.58 gnl/MRDRNA2_/MRDRNA2_103604_c0_seq1:130-2037(-)